MDTQDNGNKLISLLNDHEIHGVLYQGDASFTSVDKHVNSFIWSFVKDSKNQF